MPDQPFATGRCLCGAVTFTIKSAPLSAGQCHCKDCQRATGTGHVSHAIFKADDVEFHGETAGYTVTTDAGNEYTRYFCPKCGGRLYNQTSKAPDFVHVAAGACDDNSWFEPKWVFYTRSRPAWDLTSTDIPNHEAMPPPRT